jgi:hypothetical protein
MRQTITKEEKMETRKCVKCGSTLVDCERCSNDTFCQKCGKCHICIQDSYMVEASRPESKLREFTNDDWNAFAGCETADPLIGEFMVTFQGMDPTDLEAYESTVVVDRRRVEVHIGHNHFGEIISFRNCPTTVDAIEMAEMLCWRKTVRYDFLLDPLGFERIA